MSREMKYSGIPWIGDIPRGWVMKRLKDVGFLYGGLIGKAGDDFIAEDDESCNYMRFIPFTNIFNNTIINPNQLYKVRIEDGEKQNLVNKNDILFLMSSEDYDGVGKPAILEEQIENLSLNSFCKGFRVTNVETHPKYLLYLLLSHVVRELVRQEAKGFIRINLRQDKLSTCPIMLPSLSEQQKIASFLDRKCAEIDEMIALQEKIVEELKAYKQSVITEAVTKGLNPDVPMKDSGIEWIGNVPEHWNTRKIGTLFKLRDEKNYKSMDEVQLLSLYTGIGVFPHGEQEERGNKAVTVEGYKIVRKNDIVVNIILAWMGAIGISDYDGVTSPAYDVYIPSTSVIPHYYHYVFRTKGIAAECYKYGRGIMMMRWRTYSSEFKQIVIPFPSTEEQQEIADYLDEKCSEIDSLINIKLSKIDSLKEYKKSIIYEYVTGKKEVE